MLGGFDWDLMYTWHAIPQDERSKRLDPGQEVLPLRYSYFIEIFRSFKSATMQIIANNNSF